MKSTTINVIIAIILTVICAIAVITSVAQDRHMTNVVVIEFHIDHDGHGTLGINGREVPITDWKIVGDETNEKRRQLTVSIPADRVRLTSDGE